MMKHILGTIVLLALYPTGILAAVYKCTDASGKDSYQQQPCPSTMQGQSFISDDPNWIAIASDDSEGIRKEYILDKGAIKLYGSLRRAAFKIVYIDSNGRDMRAPIIYHFYDCSAMQVSIPFSKEAAKDIPFEEIHQQWLQPYESFRKYPQFGFAFARAEAVAQVCGTAVR